MARRSKMTVTLTPALERFIHRRVAVGRYESPSDVVRAGLRMLGEREAGPVSDVEELNRAIAVGREQARAGQFIDSPALIKRLRKRIAAARTQETRRRRAG